MSNEKLNKILEQLEKLMGEKGDGIKRGLKENHLLTMTKRRLAEKLGADRIKHENIVIKLDVWGSEIEFTLHDSEDEIGLQERGREVVDSPVLQCLRGGILEMLSKLGEDDMEYMIKSCIKADKAEIEKLMAEDAVGNKERIKDLSGRIKHSEESVKRAQADKVEVEELKEKLPEELKELFEGVKKDDRKIH